MGVKTLNIPLSDVLSEINALIVSRAPGHPNYDYVDECFHVYHDNSCQKIYVSDDTVYSDLSRIIINGNPPVTYFYASLWKLREHNTDLLVEEESMFLPGDKWNYDVSDSGCYEVRIRAHYTLTQQNTTVTVDKNINLKINLDCCSEERSDLICKIRNKIASVSCKIKDWSHIGRDFSKLIKTQYKLQVILWGIENCRLCCKDVSLYKCAFDKIIVDCGC